MKTLQIVTNTNCNLQCTYCYEKLNQKVNTFSNIKSQIDSIWPVFTKGEEDKIVEVIGGEALLYVDMLEQIFQYMLTLDNSVHFSLITNGTLIHKDNKVQNFLLKYKDILKLGCSLDGTKENHNFYRKYNDGHGSYDDVIKSVQWLKENYPRNMLRTKVTFTHETIDKLYESVINLIELDFTDKIGSMPVSEEKWTIEKSASITKQLFDIIDYLYEHNLENKINLFFILNKEYINLASITTKTKRERWCQCCTDVQCIGFDNKIYPCNRYCINKPNMNIGEVVQNETIYNTELINKLIGQIDNYNNDCKECSIQYWCGMCECIAYEFNENNPSEFLNQKYMCGWFHAITLTRYYARNKYIQKHMNNNK